MDKVKNYLLGQADKMTAWIGFIGLCLIFLGLHSVLVFLFILLIILPDTTFSEIFKVWTKKLRDLDTAR